MLSNPTIETLKSLKLHGMVDALEEQQQTPQYKHCRSRSVSRSSSIASDCTATISGAHVCCAERT